MKPFQSLMHVASLGLALAVLSPVAKAQTTYRWDMPNTFGRTSSDGVADLVFSEILEKKTNGRIKIVHHFDGSLGYRGRVTDVLHHLLDTSNHGVRIACCGPEPMMAAVARWSAGRGTPCTVSLETPMACGIGICFTCVAPIRDASGAWDYRRTCVEGPVFDAATVVWPETTVQPARTSTGSQHG